MNSPRQRISIPAPTKEFTDLVEQHNGAQFLTPKDLSVTNTLPRRVMLVGSCLAESWVAYIGCPNDFIMTNNLSELPDAPPQPVDVYDLQLIQIPMRRYLIPDDTFWHASYFETDVFEKAFEESVARLQQFLEMAMKWNKQHKILTFVSNFLVPQQNPMGRLAPRYDLRNPIYFIEQLNIQLTKEIANYENAYVLDIDSISASLGKRFFQDDYVELQTHGAMLSDSHYTKDMERIEAIPPMTMHYKLHRNEFLTTVWNSAAAMYKTVRQEDAVKLVIVDLDNTLWRGVIAESNEIGNETLEGWPLGVLEALSYLKKRGTLLAIASQNDEEKIKTLWPQIMRGRMSLDDFAISKIDWRPKADKIEEILNFTNILPKNTVFVDDNPVERASVEASFPAIRTLGQHPYYIKRILLWSPETQVPMVSKESAKRTEMVQAQAGRESLRKKVSREEFLKSLEVSMNIVGIESTSNTDFPRAFELINKTNQFNTTGKRWTREECETAFKNGWVFFAFTVKDRFADYGLTGVALVSGNTIEQFVMSCRVLGLDVEEKIVGAIIAFRQHNGATEITAHLNETEHNFPCRNLFAKCGFTFKDKVWIKRPKALANSA